MSTLQTAIDPDQAAAFAKGNVLVLTCLNAMLANFASVEPKASSEQVDRTLQSVSDWLHAEVSRSATWLSHTDRAGVPLRIERLTSPDAAIVEIARLPFDPGQTIMLQPQSDEETFAFLGDGWSIVLLTKPSALAREFRVQKLEVEETLVSNDGVTLAYYSVRDVDDLPRATLRVVNDRFVDVLYQGYKDPADDDIVAVLRDFLHDSSGWILRNAPTAFGCVIDADGVWHPIRHIPAGSRYPNGLGLRYLDVSRLPEDLDAGPKLDISSTAISLLPKGLTVDRIDVSGTLITDIPDGVVIRKSICMGQDQIASIGRDVPDEVEVRYFATDVVTTVGEIRHRKPKARSTMERIRKLARM